MASAPAAKSAFPPPPPFFELYTFPPPPPPLTSDQLSDARLVAARSRAAAVRASAAAALPLDLYAPPPPLHEAFIKFGEVQQAGFMMHELGADVPQMFARADGPAPSAAAAAAAASASSQQAASSADATATPADKDTHMQVAGLPEPVGVDFSASLRLLNRQYLQAYLSVLDALTSAAPASATDAVSPAPGVHVERALKRLSSIGANLSLLLSALRPHQAMQTVIQMSARQIQKRKNKTEQIRSAIAEAREFLVAHGVHYAAGSSNVEPDVDVSAAIASRVSAAHGSGEADGRPAASSVHAPPAERMDDEDKQPDTDSSQSKQAHRAAQHEHAKQLQAFLDAIPDQ